MEKKTNGTAEESTYRVILTSKGLNTVKGMTLIREALNLLKVTSAEERILLVIPEDYLVQDLIVESCKKIGFPEENIYLSRDFERLEGKSVSVCYVTEGNTFEVLDYMRRKGLTDYVKNCVQKGGIYIGSSAGALIAGKDISPAGDFDLNFCGMRDFEALDLLGGTIVIPHYSYQQLQQYLSMFGAKGDYKSIKNVADDEVLLFEVVRADGVWSVMKEKRVKKETNEGEEKI